MIQMKLFGLANAKALFKDMDTKLINKLNEEVQHWAFQVEAKAKNNIKDNFSQRTGNLRSSISSQVEKSGAAWKWKVLFIAGSRQAPYAKAHEEGDDDVRPKNAKYLTVPFPGMEGMRASDFPKSEKLVHDGIIWQLTSSKNALRRPLFSLHRSIKIPARPYLRPAIEDSLGDLKSAMEFAWIKYGDQYKGEG